MTWPCTSPRSILAMCGARKSRRKFWTASAKPEPVIEKIVNGKMEKFYEENCLYEQHFIKDESVTVGELVSQMIHKLGENISIRRYVRFKVGEGAGSSAESAAVAAPAS